MIARPTSSCPNLGRPRMRRLVVAGLVALVLVVTVAPAASGEEYIIRRGDTLSAIARKFGLPTAKLADHNGIVNPDRVYAGQRISIPTATIDTSRLPAKLVENPDRLALIPAFEKWAAHYRVPADLLKALTWLESGWQQGKVSPKGAIGIGQLMPRTATWMVSVIGVPLDPAVADDNIRISARYLKYLLDRTGNDARAALAGYVQGLRSVAENGMYTVTRRYVDDVLALRPRFL